MSPMAIIYYIDNIEISHLGMCVLLPIDILFNYLLGPVIQSMISLLYSTTFFSKFKKIKCWFV